MSHNNHKKSILGILAERDPKRNIKSDFVGMGEAFNEKELRNSLNDPAAKKSTLKGLKKANKILHDMRQNAESHRIAAAKRVLDEAAGISNRD